MHTEQNFFHPSMKCRAALCKVNAAAFRDAHNNALFYCQQFLGDWSYTWMNANKCSKILSLKPCHESAISSSLSRRTTKNTHSAFFLSLNLFAIAGREMCHVHFKLCIHFHNFLRFSFLCVQFFFLLFWFVFKRRFLVWRRQEKGKLGQG
jgi:hypothetical protein